MLDGGHLLLLRHRGDARPAAVAHASARLAQQVGFVLLMLLMVFALYNDLVRIDAFKFFR